MSISANVLRLQIEAVLASRIPAALTPMRKQERPRQPTGIATLDAMLGGGLPVGAVTEIVGAECSGRTSLALSLIACVSASDHVAAWIDVSDALDPESAAACGVNLDRLLWVRCGVACGKNSAATVNNFSVSEKYFAPPPVKKGLHGGGFGPHPREEGRGMSGAVGDFLRQPGEEKNKQVLRFAQNDMRRFPQQNHSKLQKNFPPAHASMPPAKPWSRMEQALHVTDLLLQAGGFRAIVLDMAGIAPEHASRVPLATWFRYRAAAERTQCSFILLTQHACAKSSAGLVLRLEAVAQPNEPTIFTGQQNHIQIARDRFARDGQSSNVIPMRKPPQSERGATWQSKTAWQGPRSGEFT